MRHALLTAMALAAFTGGCGFSVTDLEPVQVSAWTGEKPQSKVWHLVTWQMVMPDSEGTWLWTLNETTWKKGIKLSEATNTRADVKSLDRCAYVLMLQGANAELVLLDYNIPPETVTNRPWVTSHTLATIPTPHGVEAATIDIDGAGRMWMAYDARADIRVRWADPPYKKWSEPIVIAPEVNVDDICAITALSDGSVGVLWSNQLTKRFGFRTHAAGAKPDDWSKDELPAARSAADVGDGMADDHLNLAVASDGTLYAAVKTSYDTPGHPLIALLVRRPDGTWDKMHNVDDEGSRGIVLLDEQANRITVVYTSYRDKRIICKTSPTWPIWFGRRQTLIDTNANNPSSTKHNHAGQTVIITSQRKTLHSVRLGR